MSLSINVRNVGTVQVIETHGRLILGDPIQELRETMRRLLADGARRFVLDFSHITYMDSSGLGEVLGIYTMVGYQNGRVVLLSPSARVGLLLQIAKLATIFEIHDTEAAAVDALLTGDVPVRSAS